MLVSDGAIAHLVGASAASRSERRYHRRRERAPRRCAACSAPARCSPRAAARRRRPPRRRRRQAEADLRLPGRLAEAREPDQGAASTAPAWLPDPLKGQIGGQWNNINSVSADRSYLESFVWQETGGGAAGGELHVNLRAYPGRTTIPTCRTGGADSRNVPCYADPGRQITANGITDAALHGQPGRRRVARTAALAARRHALHALRARRAAADVRPRRAVPEAGARVARADQARRLMKLTRRQLVVGTAAGAVGAAGIYELVDQLAGLDAEACGRRRRSCRSSICSTGSASCARTRSRCSSRRSTTASSRRVSRSTAPTCATRSERSRRTLAALEADYAPSPAGLGVTVAWGSPYFEQFVPAAAKRLLAARPARRQVGAARRRALPERSRRHAARAQPRRDPPALRLAGAHRRRARRGSARRSSSSSRRSAAASQAAASTVSAHCRSSSHRPRRFRAPT